MAQNRFVVAPPGLNPRRRGTLVAAGGEVPFSAISDPANPLRWIGGVAFQALGCSGLQRAETILCDDERVFSDFSDLGDNVDFDSFTVRGAIANNSLCDGNEAAAFDLRTRFSTAATAQVAAELIEGGARATAPSVNPDFVSIAQVGSATAYSPTAAISLLEQAISDIIPGAQANLHLTVRGLSEVAHLGNLQFDGDRVISPLGNVVIADPGNSGPAPDAADAGASADEWWYASGPVLWAMTQPEMIGTLGQRFDRTGNFFQHIYEAQAIVMFDPCSVVAVPVSYSLSIDGATIDGGTP